MAFRSPQHGFNRAINLPNALIGGVLQVKTHAMAIGTNPDFNAAFAATLAWWREAGVDAAFEDEPRSWFPEVVPADDAKGKQARPHQKSKVKAPEPPTPVDVAATLPDDLEAFRSWWMTTPELDSGRLSGRVPPRGSTGAKLMIIGPMPESGDREHLFAGSEGKLLDQFLSTSGLDPDAIYWASAMPCHSPGTDWAPDNHRLIIEAMLKHITLVRPERLLVIGFNVLPLLRHSSAQGPAVSSVFNHEGATVPLLAVRRIPALAAQPRWKSVLWQAWLNFTA
jgi:uracil-DNA glycosylase family 4